MSSIPIAFGLRVRPQIVITIVGLLGICLCTGVAIKAMAADQIALTLVALAAMPLGVAILVWPDMFTVAVIFILYINAAAVAVKFHNMPYAVAALFPMVLAAPLAHYILVRREHIIVTPVVPFLIVFFVVQTLGVVFSSDMSLAMVRYLEFIFEGFALYILITNVVRTPNVLRAVIWGLLVSGLIMGALSVYQQITHTFSDNYGGFAQMTSEGFYSEGRGVTTSEWQARLSGPIGEQNRYAQIMLMLVPLGIFLMFSERRWWARALAGIATIFSLAGCALTFSRGAAVAFGLVLFIMACMRYISFRWLGLLFVSCLILLLALPQYATRLSSLTTLVGLGTDDQSAANAMDGAVKGRATEMMAAFLCFLDNPVIGVGPGMFHYHVHEYTETIALREIEGTRQAHSLYLGVAADDGIAGLFCLMVILAITLRELAQARRRLMHSHPDLALLVTGVFFAVVAYMATGLFLHLSYVRYLWLILAIGGSAAYIARTLVPDPPNTAPAN